MRLVLIFLAISIPLTFLMGTSAGRGKFLNVERFIDNSIIWILLIIFAFIIVFFIIKAPNYPSGDDGE